MRAITRPNQSGAVTTFVLPLATGTSEQKLAALRFTTTTAAARARVTVGLRQVGELNTFDFIIPCGQCDASGGSVHVALSTEFQGPVERLANNGTVTGVILENSAGTVLAASLPDLFWESDILVTISDETGALLNGVTGFKAFIEDRSTLDVRP